jgi:hypothetical protein
MSTSSESPTEMPSQVVYVERKGNGNAVAGFVLGIVGTVLGLVPILAVPALICGLLGVVLGGVGWRAVKLDATRGHRGLAIAGTILGVVAIVLAFIGFAIVANAFNS